MDGQKNPKYRRRESGTDAHLRRRLQPFKLQLLSSKYSLRVNFPAFNLLFARLSVGFSNEQFKVLLMSFHTTDSNDSPSSATKPAWLPLLCRRLANKIHGT